MPEPANTPSKQSEETLEFVPPAPLSEEEQQAILAMWNSGLAKLQSDAEK